MRKMFGRNTWIFAVLSVLLVSTLASAATLPAFRSKNPKFARIALNQAGTKVLSLAFDESKGTGKGYDTLYADSNFNGSLETSEKQVSESKQGQAHAFRGLNLPVPYNNKAKGMAHPCSVNVVYNKTSAGTGRGTAEWFYAYVALFMKQSNEDWQYVFPVVLKPADRLSKATVVKLSTPTYKMDVRPETANSKSIGIALDLRTGEQKAMVNRNGASAVTKLTITDSKGKIVKQDKGDINNFGFG